MSDQLRDEIDRLLDDAGEGLDELPSLDDEASDEDAAEALAEANGLDDLAAEANDLIETNDSGELLEAVGLAEFPDGSEPESIPEAIARGDPEDIVELRSLLKLANLADLEGDELREGVDELRETIDDRSVDEIEETASSEDEEETDAVDDESRPDEADESSEAEEGEGDFTEQLRSAISGDLEGFRDELEQARDRFAELRDGENDDEDDEENEEGAEGEATEEDEDEEEDDGLFGTEEDSSGGRGTRHSTMAPPPSERADMGRSTRHSTMPDRN